MSYGDHFAPQQATTTTNQTTPVGEFLTNRAMPQTTTACPRCKGTGEIPLHNFAGERHVFHFEGSVNGHPTLYPSEASVRRVPLQGPSYKES